ncbi:hypothetical protein [Uliginosibacterium sp. 31-12]|uniref:hypothetical protein n=1 Tax=Uliginosibacterium sp. 31-12 TaxID=3062781 RepID=UPI0026E43DED|nr:hypothetical protein [Uliginosibacterium sp. 31-12]MDO6387496.1 hypothetical protein [Uliginosibacterium sp. 31-12]
MRFRPYLSCLAALLALFLGACAGPAGMNREEPRDIIVRNLSERDFASVTLQNVRTSNAPGASFGQIAPLPRGVSQIYGRPSNPARLPDQLMLVLTEPSGYQHTRDCELSTVLGQRDNPALEMALVFEISRTLAVRIFLEPVQR